jgi:hypothetical protein
MMQCDALVLYYMRLLLCCCAYPYLQTAVDRNDHTCHVSFRQAIKLDPKLASPFSADMPVVFYGTSTFTIQYNVIPNQAL